MGRGLRRKRRKKEGVKEKGEGGFRRESKGKGGRMKRAWFDRLIQASRASCAEFNPVMLRRVKEM